MLVTLPWLRSTPHRHFHYHISRTCCRASRAMSAYLGASVLGPLNASSHVKVRPTCVFSLGELMLLEVLACRSFFTLEVWTSKAHLVEIYALVQQAQLRPILYAISHRCFICLPEDRHAVHARSTRKEANQIALSVQWTLLAAVKTEFHMSRRALERWV